MDFDLAQLTKQALESIKAWFFSVRALLKEPYKWVLHPSVWRIRWVGLFVFLGNPLFYLIWTELAPQPFESLTIRICMSLLGLLLLIKSNAILKNITAWKYFYTVVLYIQLPLLFLVYATLNGFNNVWLGSCAAMVLIYYQATDWRLASIGVILALIGSHLITANTQPIDDKTTFVTFQIVFGFAWASAVVAGGSAANLLKQHQANTFFNLGVMAHELRTPIASINVLNHILNKTAIELQHTQLTSLSQKLSNLVKTINQHINDQIANSKTDRGNIELLNCSALDLVEQTVKMYPFKDVQESAIVIIKCQDNFCFIGNTILYTQVLNNLIKNAFHAMHAKELSTEQMSLTIEIKTSDVGKKNIGLITLTDNGTGIKPEHLSRASEPFFSTASGLSHGLGLSFCKNVLESNQGRLIVESTYGEGAAIRLELPRCAV